MNERFWKTALSAVEPNKILIRGYRVQDLMANCTFGDIIYLTFKGELPAANEGRMIEMIVVSSTDHSFLAPSIDATRFVASGGVPLQASVAAGIISLGDHHGGAIEQCQATSPRFWTPLARPRSAHAHAYCRSEGMEPGRRPPGPRGIDFERASTSRQHRRRNLRNHFRHGHRLAVRPCVLHHPSRRRTGRSRRRRNCPRAPLPCDRHERCGLRWAARKRFAGKI